MRLVQDRKGRWIGRPAFALKVTGDRPPVAIDDVAAAEPDGPAILIDVLGNDVEPEGGALTLTSAFAAIGTAVVENGRVRYTPAPGFSGTDTVVYEITDPVGQTDTGQATVTVAAPVLAAEATAENLIEVTAATGPIDVTVSEPADLAGTYGADLAALGAGPVNLKVPSVTGDSTIGAILTAKPGLWVHTTGESPVRTWSWTRDGVTIADAMDATRVIEVADQGATLVAVETLGDAYGARSAASAGVTAEASSFTPVLDAGLIGWWDADDATTLTVDGGRLAAWADKTGTATLSQPGGLWQPAVGARLLGGRPVLDFDGNNRHLEGNIALPATGNFSLHMAVVIDALSSEYAAIVAVEATRDFQIDAGAPAQFDGRLNAAGIGTTTALSGGPFSGGQILSLVFDRTGAGIAKVYLGGTERAAMTLTDAVDAAAALHVMTNRSKNAGITGAVAEIVLTGDVTNRLDHHDYLSAKWGLS